MKRRIHALLFSGFCVFISCEYILIQEQKTWDDAQAYCRQNHFDLATVQNTEDWTRVERAVGSSLASLVWIGLYNDINGWRWSYQDKQNTFVAWGLNQPDNREGIQECICIDNSKWIDTECNNEYAVFCYNEARTLESRFVYVNDMSRNWSEAQTYCRQHHTDMAIIQTQEENNHLQMSNRAWIGLFRDSWKWSDGTHVSLSSINWMSTTRVVEGRNRPCGAADASGMMYDKDCSTTLPFVCKQFSKKQIVRLEMKSGLNVNDPAVMDTVLQWIRQKLKDNGIEKDTTLTWRLQSDGKVFSPKSDDEENPTKEYCSQTFFE